MVENDSDNTTDHITDKNRAQNNKKHKQASLRAKVNFLGKNVSKYVCSTCSFSFSFTCEKSKLVTHCDLTKKL